MVRTIKLWTDACGIKGRRARVFEHKHHHVVAQMSLSFHLKMNNDIIRKLSLCCFWMCGCAYFYECVPCIWGKVIISPRSIEHWLRLTTSVCMRLGKWTSVFIRACARAKVHECVNQCAAYACACVRVRVCKNRWVLVKLPAVYAYACACVCVCVCARV